MSLSYQDAEVESEVTETSKVSECNNATNAEGLDGRWPISVSMII